VSTTFIRTYLQCTRAKLFCRSRWHFGQRSWVIQLRTRRKYFYFLFMLFFSTSIYNYIYSYMVEIFRIVKYLFVNLIEMAGKIHGQVQDLWEYLMMLNWFLTWRIYQLQLITKSSLDMNHKYVLFYNLYLIYLLKNNQTLYYRYM